MDLGYGSSELSSGRKEGQYVGVHIKMNRSVVAMHRRWHAFARSYPSACHRALLHAKLPTRIYTRSSLRVCVTASGAGIIACAAAPTNVSRPAIESVGCMEPRIALHPIHQVQVQIGDSRARRRPHPHACCMHAPTTRRRTNCMLCSKLMNQMQGQDEPGGSVVGPAGSISFGFVCWC